MKPYNLWDVFDALLKHASYFVISAVMGLTLHPGSEHQAYPDLGIGGSQGFSRTLAGPEMLTVEASSVVGRWTSLPPTACAPSAPHSGFGPRLRLGQAVLGVQYPGVHPVSLLEVLPAVCCFRG